MFDVGLTFPGLVVFGVLGPIVRLVGKCREYSYASHGFDHGVSVVAMAYMAGLWTTEPLSRSDGNTIVGPSLPVTSLY